jgi:DNA-binding protein HU-beta
MAAKKPAKIQATVTLKHLAAELAEGHEIAKKKSEAVLSDLVTSITKHLKKGPPRRNLWAIRREFGPSAGV